MSPRPRLLWRPRRQWLCCLSPTMWLRLGLRLRLRLRLDHWPWTLLLPLQWLWRRRCRFFPARQLRPRLQRLRLPLSLRYIPRLHLRPRGHLHPRPHPSFRVCLRPRPGIRLHRLQRQLELLRSRLPPRWRLLCLLPRLRLQLLRLPLGLWLRLCLRLRRLGLLLRQLLRLRLGLQLLRLLLEPRWWLGLALRLGLRLRLRPRFQ